MQVYKEIINSSSVSQTILIAVAGRKERKNYFQWTTKGLQPKRHPLQAKTSPMMLPIMNTEGEITWLYYNKKAEQRTVSSSLIKMNHLKKT